MPSRILVVVALVVVASVAACTGGPASTPTPSGPLVTVTTRGGECFDGPCGSVIAIGRDGAVHEAAKPPNDLGTVPPELVTALDAAIRGTDFDAVRAVAFSGECPTAFDGQEVIYEFGGPKGPERVASCETAIDPDQPVFAATTAALVAVGVLAAP